MRAAALLGILAFGPRPSTPLYAIAPRRATTMAPDGDHGSGGVDGNALLVGRLSEASGEVGLSSHLWGNIERGGS